MNNNEKFKRWISDAKSHESDSLDQIISVGLIKSKKKKFIATILRSSIAALFVLLISFSVLVNTSYAFAQSVINIPPLRAIMKLVALDSTLKAALNNEYIQLIGETRETDNGFLSIHYIIADAQQLTVFVTAKNIDFDQSLVFDNNNKKILCVISEPGFVPDTAEPELISITYDIADGYKLSDNIRLDYIQKDSGKTLSYNINLDKKFRNNLTEHKINNVVNLNGQLINLDKIRISPTKARLFITVYGKNTAYIKSLNLSLRDEHSKAWNTESNGISGQFNVAGTDIESIMLESSYFSKPKHLNLEISGYASVLKAKSQFIFDFDNQKFESLPDFVQLKEVSSVNGKLTLTLTGHISKADNFMQLFSHEFVDASGIKHEIPSQGKRSSANGSISDFIIEIDDLKTGKAVFTLANSPQQKIEPIVIPIY